MQGSKEVEFGKELIKRLEQQNEILRLEKQQMFDQFRGNERQEISQLKQSIRDDFKMHTNEVNSFMRLSRQTQPQVQEGYLKQPGNVHESQYLKETEESSRANTRRQQTREPSPKQQEIFSSEELVEKRRIMQRGRNNNLSKSLLQDERVGNQPKNKQEVQVQKDQMVDEIFKLQEQRKQLNNEYQKLNMSNLRSGMMIRKKKELEQELKQLNKLIADKKNDMRLLKHED